MASFGNGAIALCTMSVEMAILGVTMVGFEIVFNLIDLRNGIHGVAAGPYMPIALPIYAFCFISGVLYFTILLPAHAAPDNPVGILLHVTLILGSLADWLLLDEKGTVPFHCVLSSQLYPILFHAFGFFRTVIWPEDPIYNNYMYALPFLNYLGPNIFWYSVLFFAGTLLVPCLFVLFNNILAGKYSSARYLPD